MVNIVVIGAGLSGLVCAKELLRHSDYHIHVLEARGRYGGRMYQEAGVDLGATWSWPAHDLALMRLSQELGVKLEQQYSKGSAIAHFVPLEGNGEGSTQTAGRDMSPAGEGSVRFENGAASIIDRLVNELKTSERITFTLNQEVKSITLTSEDPAVYEVNSVSTLTPPTFTENATCSDLGGDMSLSASIVVLALPPQLAATITFSPPLPQSKLNYMEQTPTWMANTGKVAFIYDKPFWKNNGLSGTAFSRGGPMAQIWDASSDKGISPDRHALSSFVFDDDLKYLAGDDCDSLIRHSPIMKELVEIFGKDAATPKRVVFKSWLTDPYTSREAKQLNTVSHTTQIPFGHSLVSRPEKGIIFSGTETSLNENGHMNGAVIAGIRAAEEAIKFLAAGGNESQRRE